VISRNPGEGRYAHFEREQRWILRGRPDELDQPVSIVDLYIRGTRLRLHPVWPGPRTRKESWNNGPVPRNYFDERIAKGYDAKWADLAEPAIVDPAVNFLADLAGTGAALELGIGTGRIALPLSQRGVRVHGIELSPAMVAQLRAKPGSDDIGVTIGDFATTTVGETFALAYLVRNTITNLTTQDEQVRAFANVAAHLEPGGTFVIEVFVPELQRLPPGETFQAFTVTHTHLGFNEYEIADQILYSHHYWVVDGRLETFSAPFRYVWPSELDLMARLAGLALRERWSNWEREPFTSASRSHVSVWEKVDG